MAAPNIYKGTMYLGKTWLRSCLVCLSLQTQPNWDQKGQEAGRQRDGVLCHCQLHFHGDLFIHGALI